MISTRWIPRLLATGAAAVCSLPASADVLFEDFSSGSGPQVRRADDSSRSRILTLGAEAISVRSFRCTVPDAAVSPLRGGLVIPSGGAEIGYFGQRDANVGISRENQPFHPLLDLSRETAIAIEYRAEEPSVVSFGVTVFGPELASSDSLRSAPLNVDQPGTYRFELQELFRTVDPTQVGGVELRIDCKGDLSIARILATAAAGVGGNSCSSATAIAGQGTFGFNNFSASTSGVTPECGIIDDIFNDVWLAWTADATGTAALSLCGPGNDDDTIMAVWKEGEGCPPLRQIACDNDYCFLFGPSRNVIGVEAGETYLIQLGAVNPSDRFSGQLFVGIFPNQAGDFCDFAIPFAGEGSVAYDNSGYERNNEPPTCANPATDIWDIWYRWTPGVTGVGTVSNCGFPGSRTILQVWDDSLGCPPTVTIGCDDGFVCFGRSELSFPVVAGESYLIQVGDAPLSLNTGPDNLSFSIAAPPANDACAAASAISGTGSFEFDTTLATLDHAGSTCGSLGRNIWFDWVPPETGSFTIDTCGTGFDTQLAVWGDVNCPPTMELACDDDSCGPGSRVTFNATSGVHYLIELLGEEGVGDLHVTRVNGACMATMSSNGCLPEISFRGSPTLEGLDNFSLLASQVNGQTTGFLSWGSSLGPPPAAGGSVRPFGYTSTSGGVRCIYAPRATDLQPTGGTGGMCDGTLEAPFSQSQMLSAGVFSGSTLVFQWLIVDPGVAGGLARTAALEFTVQ